MRRVLVTGASSGIGAACVAAFQGLGDRVLGVDLHESSRADDHLQLDLSRPDCGERVAEFCGEDALHGLVNNAAMGFGKAAIETAPDEFDRVMHVNLRAPFLVASALFPWLRDSRGFVVNVGSVHAKATSQYVSAYAASKGGLTALTRALAIEWAPEVRVNAVNPGAVETAMLDFATSRTGQSLKLVASKHPLGRVGTSAEIADAVLFLASNPFMTGSVLDIDGGATARLSTE